MTTPPAAPPAPVADDEATKPFDTPINNWCCKEKNCHYFGQSKASSCACIHDAAPDDLVAQIQAFLADAPKGIPHTGYRYGELLDQAAAAIVALRERIAELEETFDTLRGNAKYQQDRAERAEAELREERAIVDRIWDLFGRPSYESLKGRTIYDLIGEVQADNAALRAVLLELVEAGDDIIETVGKERGIDDAYDKASERNHRAWTAARAKLREGE